MSSTQKGVDEMADELLDRTQELPLVDPQEAGLLEMLGGDLSSEICPECLFCMDGLSAAARLWLLHYGRTCPVHGTVTMAGHAERAHTMIGCDVYLGGGTKKDGRWAYGRLNKAKTTRPTRWRQDGRHAIVLVTKREIAPYNARVLQEVRAKRINSGYGVSILGFSVLAQLLRMDILPVYPFSFRCPCQHGHWYANSRTNQPPSKRDSTCSRCSGSMGCGAVEPLEVPS